MSQIKMTIRNRRNGRECLCGGEELVVVFPYGLSPLASSVEEELQKVRLAEKLGVDMVKDNSVGRREWYELLSRVSREIDLPIGASAMLAAANLAVDSGSRPAGVIERLFYQGFEKLAEICDAIEVFPTITQESLKVLAGSKRVNKIVISRAGSIIVNFLQRTGGINPYFRDFDWFLDQAKEKNITLIIGNGFRASCLADSFDEVQLLELQIAREFASRAVARGVSIIVGVFGHIDPSQTDAFKRAREEIPVPIGGLGPLATDIALGYDHINLSLNPYSMAIARVVHEKWPDGCTLCGDWCPFTAKPTE